MKSNPIKDLAQCSDKISPEKSHTVLNTCVEGVGIQTRNGTEKDLGN